MGTKRKIETPEDIWQAALEETPVDDSDVLLDPKPNLSPRYSMIDVIWESVGWLLVAVVAFVAWRLFQW